MELTKAEREMLDGKNGKGTQKCMKLLVTMGEIAGAKKMVPIVSGHIAGNYAVMEDEGIEWLEEIGGDGARLKIYTTKNPEMFDFDNPQELGVPERVQKIQEQDECGPEDAWRCPHLYVSSLSGR